MPCTSVGARHQLHEREALSEVLCTLIQLGSEGIEIDAYNVSRKQFYVIALQPCNLHPCSLQLYTV